MARLVVFFSFDFPFVFLQRQKVMEVKQEAEGAVPVDAQASLAYSAVAPGTHVDMERAAGATAGESEMDEDAGLVDQQAAAAAAAAAAAPGAGLSRQQRKQMAKQQVDERERLAELKRTLKAAVATPESDRTPEQVSLLSQHPHLVKKVRRRWLFGEIEPLYSQNASISSFLLLFFPISSEKRARSIQPKETTQKLRHGKKRSADWWEMG